MSKNIEKIKLSWDEMCESCEDIVEKIKDTGVAIDTVVAIARGGVIPGSIIARAINAKLQVIKASSYGEDNKRGDLEADTVFADGNVLLVDDICDSGNTLNHIERNVVPYSSNSKIYTSAIYYKPNKLHDPDFWSRILPNDPPVWVIFPWELD